MALTVSLVVFAGIIVVVLLSTGYLRLWPALSSVAGWLSTLG
ncbi:hypothetical protein AB0A60_32655 [Streptomyces sp. NPDC046275]